MLQINYAGAHKRQFVPTKPICELHWHYTVHARNAYCRQLCILTLITLTSNISACHVVDTSFVNLIRWILVFFVCISNYTGTRTNTATVYLCPVSEIQRDIGRKSPIFPTPPVFGAHFEGNSVGIKINALPVCVIHYLIDWSTVNTISARDRWTDRQTDRQTDRRNCCTRWLSLAYAVFNRGGWHKWLRQSSRKRSEREESNIICGFSLFIDFK